MNDHHLSFDELAARQAAGEEITVTVLPDHDDGPFWFGTPTLKPEDIQPVLARNAPHIARDTHVAELDDCPLCEAGVPLSPTGRSVEALSPELQRFKEGLDKYSHGDMEVIRAMREYLDNRNAESMKPLLDIVVPPVDLDYRALELRALAMLESKEGIYIGRNRTIPPVVVYMGDHHERPSIHSIRYQRDALFDEAGLGKSLALEATHIREPIPKLDAMDIYIEPKKPKGDFVGRHGEMPVPSRQRKKFKKRLHANKGRRK